MEALDGGLATAFAVADAWQRGKRPPSHKEIGASFRLSASQARKILRLAADYALVTFDREGKISDASGLLSECRRLVAHEFALYARCIAPFEGVTADPISRPASSRSAVPLNTRIDPLLPGSLRLARRLTMAARMYLRCSVYVSSRRRRCWRCQRRARLQRNARRRTRASAREAPVAGQDKHLPPDVVRSQSLSLAGALPRIQIGCGFDPPGRWNGEERAEVAYVAYLVDRRGGANVRSFSL